MFERRAGHEELVLTRDVFLVKVAEGVQEAARADQDIETALLLILLYSSTCARPGYHWATRWSLMTTQVSEKMA
jgi:hypothetical protein